MVPHLVDRWATPGGRRGGAEVFDPTTEQVIVTASRRHVGAVRQGDRCRSAGLFDVGAWGDRPSEPRYCDGSLTVATQRGAHSGHGIRGGPAGLTRPGASRCTTIEFVRWKFAEAAELDRTLELILKHADFPAGAGSVPADGVVAAITAYNSPLLPAVDKIGAALAAGPRHGGVDAVEVGAADGPWLLGEILPHLPFPNGVVNVVKMSAERTSDGALQRMARGWA